MPFLGISVEFDIPSVRVIHASFANLWQFQEADKHWDKPSTINEVDLAAPLKLLYFARCQNIEKLKGICFKEEIAKT